MFHRVVRPKYVNVAVMAKYCLILLSIAVGCRVLLAGNDVHSAKCDSIYYNLLRAPSILFIREFFETANCDDIFDMSVYRRDYASKINRGDEKRLQRILDFKSNKNDEAIAAQAVLHYRNWHESRLLKAVSWSSWWSASTHYIFF